jgi:hypothetical protein
MAVTALDLLSPTGMIEPELFSGEYENDNDALTLRLNEYAMQATTLAAAYTFESVSASDSAIKSYAYYLAFKAAYTLALARPAEDDADVGVLGRTEFKQDQRDALRDLYEEHLSEWHDQLPVSEDGAAAIVGIPSYQSNQTYDW